MFGFKLIVGLIIRHRGFDQHVFLTDKGRWLAGKMPFIQQHNLFTPGKEQWIRDYILGNVTGEYKEKKNE